MAPKSVVGVVGCRSSALPTPPRGNLVLMTHGSTIQAVTGINPATAEMVIVTPQRDGRFAVAGRLTVP
jgi:hypothetical protein